MRAEVATFLDRATAWATASEDVRGSVLIGSQARSHSDAVKAVDASACPSHQPLTTPSIRPLKNSRWAKVKAMMPGVTTMT